MEERHNISWDDLDNLFKILVDSKKGMLNNLENGISSQKNKKIKNQASVQGP
jgi:hypothetical protein